jgi:hypothetical protein
MLAAVACLATAPLVAQERAAPPASAPQTTVTAQSAAGPRLAPGYRSYQPSLARDESAATMTAAAADRTVITISTVGLVLLVVLLIILLA